MKIQENTTFRNKTLIFFADNPKDTDWRGAIISLHTLFDVWKRKPTRIGEDVLSDSQIEKILAQIEVDEYVFDDAFIEF